MADNIQLLQANGVAATLRSLDIGGGVQILALSADTPVAANTKLVQQPNAQWGRVAAAPNGGGIDEIVASTSAPDAFFLVASENAQWYPLGTVTVGGQPALCVSTAAANADMQVNQEGMPPQRLGLVTSGAGYVLAITNAAPNASLRLPMTNGQTALMGTVLSAGVHTLCAMNSFRAVGPNFLNPALTLTRATIGTDLLPSDTSRTTFTQFAAGAPRFRPNGRLLVEEARTNLFLNSGAPATQAVTLGVGTFAVWLLGPGSITSAAGTAVGSGFGAATAGSPNIITITTGGTVNLTVAGNPVLAQCEQLSAAGSAPSSYIPTAGATVTRNADLISAAVGAWFSAANDTIVVRANYLYTGAAMPRVVQIDDGTINNRIANIWQNNSNRLFIATGGVTQADMTAAGTTNPGTGAAAFAANSANCALNNVLGALDSTVTLPAVTTFRVGSDSAGVSGGIEIERVDLIPLRLTDAQIQAQSALT